MPPPGQSFSAKSMSASEVPALPAAQESALALAVRESVTNVVRHAGAEHDRRLDREDVIRDEHVRAAVVADRRRPHGLSDADYFELLERLRAAPEGLDAGAESEARCDAVLGYVRVIRSLNASMKQLNRSVVTHLGEHPDNEIFTSLPRSGQVNAAQMLAEWGDSREAYDGPDAVCALAGLAPVTKKSGKYKTVEFRWACNTRFRRAVTTFADNSRHDSAWAADIYQRAIARGCDHPHAVRILARAWLHIIWHCWRDGLAYNPENHRALQRVLANQNEVA